MKVMMSMKASKKRKHPMHKVFEDEIQANQIVDSIDKCMRNMDLDQN